MAKENEQENQDVREEKVEEVVEEGVDKVEEAEEAEVEEKEADDRPALNYQKELERKNRALEKVQQELEVERSRQVKRYDPNDITTWSDQDLKAVMATNDPKFVGYKDQAQDVLLDRKIEKIRATEVAKEKRVRSEIELRKFYPEALDSTSKFAIRMDEVLHELDLDKTPAGRLAAAKIVAAEQHGAKASANARGRKTEQERVARVKGSMNSGDRPQGESLLQQKERQDRAKKIQEGDQGAFMDELKTRLPKRSK